jgi:hypothetical protein
MLVFWAVCHVDLQVDTNPEHQHQYLHSNENLKSHTVSVVLYGSESCSTKCTQNLVGKPEREKPPET